MKRKTEKKEPKITNIMADGSICEDLSHYLDDHELPETVKVLLANVMRHGREILEQRMTQEDRS